MSSFDSKPKFEDNLDRTFTMLAPMVYHSDLLKRDVTIPEGFRTDLASIPRGLWNILPPIGEYDAAAIVHDYLYKYNGVTREQADKVLEEGMIVCNTPSWRRKMIYLGVRVGGWVPWNRYRKAEKNASN